MKVKWLVTWGASSKGSVFVNSENYGHYWITNSQLKMYAFALQAKNRGLSDVIIWKCFKIGSKQKEGTK